MRADIEAEEDQGGPERTAHRGRPREGGDPGQGPRRRPPGAPSTAEAVPGQGGGEAEIERPGARATSPGPRRKRSASSPAWRRRLPGRSGTGRRTEGARKRRSDQGERGGDGDRGRPAGGDQPRQAKGGGQRVGGRNGEVACPPPRRGDRHLGRDRTGTRRGARKRHRGEGRRRDCEGDRRGERDPDQRHPSRRRQGREEQGGPHRSERRNRPRGTGARSPRHSTDGQNRRIARHGRPTERCYRVRGRPFRHDHRPAPGHGDRGRGGRPRSW